MNSNFNAEASSSSGQPRGLRRKDYVRKYDKKRAGTRHSMKLPSEHRARFEEPYDEFLSGMLDILPSQPAPGVSPYPPGLIECVKLDAPRVKRDANWTVWLSTELRAEYRAKKAIVAPKLNNAEFVEFLLRLREASLIEFPIESQLPTTHPPTVSSTEISAPSAWPESVCPDTFLSHEQSDNEATKETLQELLSSLKSVQMETEPLPPYHDPMATSTKQDHLLDIGIDEQIQDKYMPNIGSSDMAPNPDYDPSLATHAPPPYLHPDSDNESLSEFLNLDLDTILPNQSEPLLSYDDSQSEIKMESPPPSPLLNWNLDGLSSDAAMSEDYGELLSSHADIDEPLPSYECSVADAEGNADEKLKGSLDVDMSGTGDDTSSMYGRDIKGFVEADLDFNADIPWVEGFFDFEGYAQAQRLAEFTQEHAPRLSELGSTHYDLDGNNNRT